MSWLFSRALGEEFLEENCSDGEPSVQLNGNHTPQAYLSSDKMTGFSRLSRFGMTFKPLTESRGEELLTLYLAGFPAKTSALPEKEQELTENDLECGHTWRGSLAKFDPVSSSWKTAQPSLLEDLGESSVIWPRSGMTANGQCWELPTLVRRTSETGSGLLPTPTAKPMGSNTHMRKQGLTAKYRYLMWPTPTVCGNYNRKGASKKSGDGLATAVNRWPTPTVNDSKNSTLPPIQIKHDNIPGAMLRNGEAPGGALNPTWVEWLMGWPLEWTDLKQLETVKFQQWQQQHGGF